MGRIAAILSFIRSSAHGAKVSDVKVDPGGGANVTAQHFAPAGDDAHPLPGDYAITVGVPRTGSEAVVGYVDPNSDQKAQAGDKRIYARDSGGVVVVEVWLQGDGTALVVNGAGSFRLSPDGSIKGDNGAGSFELAAGGNFLVNGVTIDTSGNITSPATVTGSTVAGTASLTAAGKEMKEHVHPAGTPPGDTGTNT
ncbi:MAG: hypothetical protein GY811_04520 [Myxococcales bacterium]|nr:hypothetical protein [Myxococcales bacterium]